MDIERTIEFILEREARTAVYLEESGAQIKEHHAQVKEHDAQIKEIRALLAETDRKLKLAGNMIGVGAKMMTKLIETQKRTEQKLDRFIASLSRQGPNGRPR